MSKRHKQRVKRAHPSIRTVSVKSAGGLTTWLAREKASGAAASLLRYSVNCSYVKSRLKHGAGSAQARQLGFAATQFKRYPV